MKTCIILWLAAWLPLAAIAQQKITPETIGIGTAHPIEKLYAQHGRAYLDGGPITSMLRLSDAPRQDSHLLKVQTPSSGDSFFNGGNVGIGTAAPATKMVVAGTVQSGDGFMSYSDVGVNGFMLANASKTLRWIIRGYRSETGVDNGGYDFEIIRRNDAGDHMGSALYIRRSDGNVGIGTISPGSNKLAVEGTIGARKVKVTQNTWADFVLHPAYQLPPLQEVKQFIQQHQHLPGIPSEAEVKKDGLDLGEMNKQLLQKIEELTLYVIQLKQENDAQQEMINELKTIIKK